MSEPTTSSAIAERVNSNLKLLNAQVLESIGRIRKKLDLFEKLINESNGRAQAEVVRTAEVSQTIINSIESDNLLVEELLRSAYPKVIYEPTEPQRSLPESDGTGSD